MRNELNFDFAPPARPNGGLRGMAARMVCRLGVGVDVASANTQTPTATLDAGTVINFGAGSITAPSTNTVDPTIQPSTAASGAGLSQPSVTTAPAAPAASSGLPTWLPWAVAGGLGLIIVGLVFVEIARKK